MAGDFDKLDAIAGVAGEPLDDDPNAQDEQAPASEMAKTARKRPVLLDGKPHQLREPEEASYLSSVGDSLKNFGVGVAGGLNFGMTDELYGVGAALAGGDYAAARNHARDELAQMDELAPGAQTGGAITAGLAMNALAPGAGATGGLAQTAKALAPQGIRGMAAQGALHGYGNSDKEGAGALGDAGLGALAGGGAGVATKIPGAVRATRDVFGRTKTAANNALPKVASALATDKAAEIAAGVGKRGAQALAIKKLGPMGMVVADQAAEVGEKGGLKVLDWVRNMVRQKMAGSAPMSEVAEQAAKQVDNSLSSYGKRVASDPFPGDVAEAMRLRDNESRAMDKMWDAWEGNPDNIGTSAGKAVPKTAKAIQVVAQSAESPEVTAVAKRVAAKMAEDPASGAAYHVVQVENNPAYRAAVRKATDETVKLKY